jgi:hypothetical protein
MNNEKQEILEGAFQLVGVSIKKGKPTIKSVRTVTNISNGEVYIKENKNGSKTLTAHDDLLNAVRELSPALSRVLPFSILGVVSLIKDDISEDVLKKLVEANNKNEEFVVATGIEITGNNEEEENRSVVISGHIIDTQDNKIDVKSKTIHLGSESYKIEALVIECIENIEKECELYCTQNKSSQLNLFEFA